MPDSPLASDPPSSDLPRIALSVVIMAYDEEANLPTQLERTVAFCEDACSDWQIVVVDDGSSDGTADVAKAWAARHPGHIDVVEHGVNRGMGAAIRNGYAAARLDWVTQLPADCQIHPETFRRFLAHTERVDLILSVYRKRDDGLKRDLMSFGFQAFVRGMLGQRGDYTGTMMFRRELLAQAGPLYSDSFFANLEFPIQCLRRGTTHTVVEIEALPRLSGRSKVANMRRIRLVVREVLAMKRRDLFGR